MNDPIRVEIERYLDGGMTPAEAAAFLESLRGDPEALAWLGRVLEQQALLYDAVRCRTGVEGKGGRAGIPIRARRFPRRSGNAPNRLLPWIGGLLAACVLMAWAAFYPWRKPPATPPAAEPPPAETAAVPPDATGHPLVRPAPPPPGASAPDVGRPTAAPPVLPPDIPQSPGVVPEPVPTPPPQPPLAPPLPVEPGRTVTAPTVARLERSAGIVTLADGSEIRADQALLEGQGIRVEGPGATAILRFSDGSRIEAGPGTLVPEVRIAGGRRIRLERGILSANIVARSAAGSSTTFATPHGEAVILGTSLKLVVDPEKTRLEVTEGKVRLRRTDGAAADVTAGHYAVVSPGSAPSPRPLPIDEILLGPQQAVLFGPEWRLIRDPEASGGLALENRKTSNRFPDGVNADASRAVFAFRADAGRTYFVWVRGRTLGPRDAMDRDAVFLEWPEAQVVETPGPNKGKGGRPDRALFNGFVHREGYWWIGGDADGEADAASPVTVRFPRPGRQVLAIYGYEPPVRIDAVWISAGQKTRPPSVRRDPR